MISGRQQIAMMGSLLSAPRWGFVFFKGRQQARRDSDRRNEASNATLFTEQDFHKIEQTNRYFQGIRLNTSYAKFYNEEPRHKESAQGAKTINDLPFANKEDGGSSQQSSPAMSALAAKIYSKIPQDKLATRVAELTRNYFTDIFKGENKSCIEPNLERHARQTISGLKREGYAFSLRPNQDHQHWIESAKLFKGVEVTRNNNYTTDSYQVLNEEDCTFYRLFQKEDEKLPEKEWFSQKNVVMRLVVNVSAPFSIEIAKNGQTLFQTNAATWHQFWLEMDLRPAPQFSDFTLSPADHLASYRPNLPGLTITDVDGRNLYTSYTYDEKTKKQKLINKLL